VTDDPRPPGLPDEPSFEEGASETAPFSSAEPLSGPAPDGRTTESALAAAASVEEPAIAETERSEDTSGQARRSPNEAPPGGNPVRLRREDRERPRAPRGPRPDLSMSSEPLFRESRGYRMRLEPPDLARLRELPGAKGKTDRELGEIFFDGQSERFTTSLAEDVPSPADVRVVVDPYSRQAFLAVEKKIRSILSF
jgi:hypothetical protein